MLTGVAPRLGADNRAVSSTSVPGPSDSPFEFNGSAQARRVGALSLTFSHHDGVSSLPAGGTGGSHRRQHV